VKRELRIKSYIRYADDFVVLSSDRDYLENLVPVLQAWLAEHLKLDLHPKKVAIYKWHKGVDFLGYVYFPYHAVIRTHTKQRMIRKAREAHEKLRQEKISVYNFQQTVQSYLGRLKHCRSKVLQKSVKAIGKEVS
jgi:pentatricopeptide repeat protein